MALVRWDVGMLGCWCIGALVRWCVGARVGALVLWLRRVGTLGRWDAWTLDVVVLALVCWCVGVLMLWCIGALVRWCASVLVRSCFAQRSK